MLTPGLSQLVERESENWVGLYLNVSPPRRKESIVTSDAFSMAMPGSPAPPLLISEPQDPVVGELERLGRPLVAVHVERRAGPAHGVHADEVPIGDGGAGGVEDGDLRGRRDHPDLEAVDPGADGRGARVD